MLNVPGKQMWITFCSLPLTQVLSFSCYNQKDFWVCASFFNLSLNFKQIDWIFARFCMARRKDFSSLIEHSGVKIKYLVLFGLIRFINKTCRAFLYFEWISTFFFIFAAIFIKCAQNFNHSFRRSPLFLLVTAILLLAVTLLYIRLHSYWECFLH